MEKGDLARPIGSILYQNALQARDYLNSLGPGPSTPDFTFNSHV